MRLLAHVTYYDASVTAGVDSRTAAVKTSATWREFNFQAVVRMLNEMACAYEMFSHIDVVIDVNEGHSFLERLRRWRADACDGGRLHQHQQRLRGDVAASRVASLSVVAHQLKHPFLLAWAHREHVAANIEQYDWFLSAEGDTLVPARAMATQVALATQLYAQHDMLLGFTRVVNDSHGNSYYSDIVRPAARSAVVSFDGLGEFVTPTNTYAAVWAYPRSVMRDFIKSPEWRPAPKMPVRGMRERAAWGWRGHGHLVTLAHGDALRIYHLGKSGQYHVKQRGHNAWPVEKLVQSDR